MRQMPEMAEIGLPIFRNIHLSSRFSLSLSKPAVSSARRYEFISMACSELRPDKRTLGTDGCEAAQTGSGASESLASEARHSARISP